MTCAIPAKTALPTPPLTLMRLLFSHHVALAAIIVSGLGHSALADGPERLAPNAAKQWQTVKSLFRARCVSCHGPEKQEGGLRLDRGERIEQGGDSGKAIVAKSPNDSPLLERVATTDEDERMPPAGEGTPLTEQEVAIVRAWIEAGAPWEVTEDEPSTHWAYQPIQSPLPAQELSQPQWVRNPIDAFVLRKLDAKKIAPAAEADKATLIRRVYLDLLGVLPTPAEVNAFLSDESDMAYDTMVERALQSPHYGERWARHWLDLARYADSDGYEKDRPRPNAWRYRQWVIDALNANVPFDQFTIEQIAGDLIDDHSVAQQIATGFHRNTLHNTEGGADPEEDRVKKTVDRTNTIGATWLGLTVGCAQCHTHKYDPITQREYYQLYAFFNDIDEKNVPAPTAEEAASHATALAKHQEQAQRLKQLQDDYLQTEIGKAQEAWEASAATAGSWAPIQLTRATAKHAKLETQSDAILATGPNKNSDNYVLEFSAEAPIAAIRLEVLPDKQLPKMGPGRADNGNFVLTNVSLDNGDRKLTAARADFSQNDWEVSKAINDNPDDGWAVSPQIGKRHVAVFELEQPVAAGEVVTLVLDQKYPAGSPHNLGRFRVTASQLATTSLDGLPSDVASILKTAVAERTADQQSKLAKHYRTIDPKLMELEKDITAHEAKRPKGTDAVAQAVVERAQRRDARILMRGDFLNPGDPVDREGLAVLPPIQPREGEVPDRLDLAQWLVSAENPLTARVTVNRVWQRYFGRGIVLSVDDFGSQGAEPTHPELLDWLATQLRDNGWDLKHLHRLIVSSATYRQSSAGRPDLETIDPENELLARFPRLRVEAEIVRDLALAASGLLNPKVGGPSVRPPQPAEYSKLTYANSAKWKTSGNGDQYRRGLYTFFQRTSPYPMLMTFDSPDSNECTAQRSESNTPLQALTIWNDVVFFECAQRLGRRIVEEAPSDSVEARLNFASLLCLSRPLNKAERADVLRTIHQRHVELCANASAEDLQALAGDLPEGIDAAEAAPWVLTGRVLLNLDAFIVKQ